MLKCPLHVTPQSFVSKAGSDLNIWKPFIGRATRLNKREREAHVLNSPSPYVSLSALSLHLSPMIMTQYTKKFKCQMCCLFQLTNSLWSPEFHPKTSSLQHFNSLQCNHNTNTNGRHGNIKLNQYEHFQHLIYRVWQSVFPYIIYRLCLLIIKMS